MMMNERIETTKYEAIKQIRERNSTNKTKKYINQITDVNAKQQQEKMWSHMCEQTQTHAFCMIMHMSHPPWIGIYLKYAFFVCSCYCAIAIYDGVEKLHIAAIVHILQFTLEII